MVDAEPGPRRPGDRTARARRDVGAGRRVVRAGQSRLVDGDHCAARAIPRDRAVPRGRSRRTDRLLRARASARVSGPVARNPADGVRATSHVQRARRGGSTHRGGEQDDLAGGPVRGPGARRLHRPRHAGPRRRGLRPGPRRDGREVLGAHPHRSRRLQGGGARGRAAGDRRRVPRDLRRRLSPARGLPPPDDSALLPAERRTRPRSRPRPGPVGPPEPRRITTDEGAVAVGGRPPHAADVVAVSGVALRELHRHGGRLAGRGDRQRRRLAGRQPGGGLRAELSVTSSRATGRSS